jgi:porphobilinogen synthase
MVRETSLSVNDLIYPMFVVHGENIKREIPSLPGNYHLSVDRLIEDVKEVHDLGIPAVLFFGLPEKKDEMASEAYSPVQQRGLELNSNPENRG